MPHQGLTHLKTLNEQEQAIYFHGRERRRSLAGIPELFRTHQIFGGTVMEVASIIMADTFPPLREDVITFKTAIRITADGVSGQHRGLVFELGGFARGCVLWVGDSTIGFTAGGAAASGEESVSLFDNGSDLPVGLEVELVCAARPGDGRTRLWANGNEIARDTAINDSFNGEWAGNDPGSFATAKSSLVSGNVPTASDKAPDGFDVIEPLSVYRGQVPRHFV